MKRKGSIQPMLIIGAILLIGLTIFGLSKSGILEKDTVKDETPPVADVVEKEEDEKKPMVIDPIEEDDEDIIDDVELEAEDDGDIAIGKLAPDFTLKNLDGEEVSLSDYRGKIVFLNFWATWCPFCDKEMPDLNKLDAENDDLVILAVDVMEDKETVEDYINEGGYDFEVVLDEDGSISQTYLVSGFPTSYFIDPEGILLGGVPGMMTYDQMNQILNDIR